MARRHGLLPAESAALVRQALELFAQAVAIVPRPAYEPFETVARARLVDETDWSTAALAILLGLGIWTEDKDFCGIGLATWRTRVLLDQLGLAN